MENAIASLDIAAVKKFVKDAQSADDNDAKEVMNALFEKTSRTTAMNLIKVNAPVKDIEDLFLFIVEAAKADLCPKSLTVSIIQDLLECSKKSKCSEIFAVVENHIGIWKTKEFFDQCKNSVLRMCNDMLKRLSRTIDTQFCGRINILLARSLPLNEKSGLNPTGQFNATNETEYELDESELDAVNTENGEPMDIDTVPEIPVDFKLYQDFWLLQKYFCDPNKIYLEFDVFQKNLNNVLGVFTTYKLDKRRAGTCQQADASMEGIEEEIRPDIFFAKYQTSQKLLHLQFADPQFRRYFLIQCLILVNYLQSDVKFRDDTLFLTDEQQKFITELNDKCYKLLKDTFPRGYHFSDFVKKLLSREKIWSLWKNESCPDYLATRPERDVKSYQRKPLPTYDPKKIDLGNDALNRLWSQSSNNLSACKDPKRNFVPKLEDAVTEALDHADPEQGVEEQYSCFNNEIWQWKYSRLFLIEGDGFLTLQSTPAARKPCAEFSEILKKGVFCIATHSKNNEMREKGKRISQKAEEFRVKKEEEAKKAEEEERQRKEEEAKQKAMEAALERKKKDEELAAQRAKELESISARKPKKAEEIKVEKEEEPPKSTKSDTSSSRRSKDKEPAASIPARKSRRESEIKAEQEEEPPQQHQPPQQQQPKSSKSDTKENGSTDHSPGGRRKRRRENGSPAPEPRKKERFPARHSTSNGASRSRDRERESERRDRRH